jgi:hypothetical protein
MTFTWTRAVNTSNNWSTNTVIISSMSAGQTLVRVRFRWGFYGDTSTMTDLARVSQSVMAFGIVTTIGNGTEHVPNALSESGDASPPAQRWLYWESRAPVVSSFDQAGNVVTWRDSGSTEDTQSRGMVKAPAMGAGDTLNIWASSAAVLAWDASGTPTLWMGIETLIRS